MIIHDNTPAIKLITKHIIARLFNIIPNFQNLFADSSSLFFIFTQAANIKIILVRKRVVFITNAAVAAITENDATTGKFANVSPSKPDRLKENNNKIIDIINLFLF